LTPKGGSGKHMQIEEVFDIRVKKLQLEDNELRQKIIELVKKDTAYKNNVIQETIKTFAKAFSAQHYSEDELKAEIRYNVDIFDNGYSVTIAVVVYPVQHPRAFRNEVIARDIYFYYMYFSYEKERNVAGAMLEQKLKLYIRLAELQKENEELKRELQEKRETIEELEERIEELERELEKSE
jgi:DNA repair exonuclease SbcCD ATPase subunit